MTKYKKGDICMVVGIPGEDANSGYHEFIGNVFEIVKVNEGDMYPYIGKLIKGLAISSQGNEFCYTDWNDEEIKLFKNISWKELMTNGSKKLIR